MGWFTEPFALDFMQRALWAGLLAGVTCALVGTWVVVRGLSFMGDALSHGVLPGIAIAFALGVDLMVGAGLSALVMILGVTIVQRRSRLSEDTGIGLLFVGMLALGVIILSRSTSYAGDLTSFLFGSLFGVTGGDLVVQGVVAAGVAIVVIVGYRAFLAMSFHEGKAEVLGLHPKVAHGALLVLITAAVVSSFRSVGTLMVVGLLIAPPASAFLLVRRLPVVMLLACALAAASVVVGLLVSYHWETAGGATIAFTAVVLFFAILTGREVTDAIGRKRQQRPSRVGWTGAAGVGGG